MSSPSPFGPLRRRRAPARSAEPWRNAALALGATVALGCSCGPSGGKVEAQGGRAAGSQSASASAVAASRRGRVAPGSSAGTPAPRVSGGEAAQAPSSAPPPPLEDAGQLVALEVPGFGEAVVAVPRGPASPRRVIVALHGNYDRPEWQCATWREIFSEHRFVLCPRGVPRADAPRAAKRFTFAGRARLEREVEAGFVALQERYPAMVLPTQRVLLGFSLGAILGVPMALAAGRRYAAIVAIEGGWKGLSTRQLGGFADAGGGRVLVLCAQTGCREGARALARRAAGIGLPFRHDFVQAGHRYDGEVAELLRRHAAWVLAGGEADGGSQAPPGSL